jgi:hypothetical protein
LKKFRASSGLMDARPGCTGSGMKIPGKDYVCSGLGSIGGWLGDRVHFYSQVPFQAR